MWWDRFKSPGYALWGVVVTESLIMGIIRDLQFVIQ